MARVKCPKCFHVNPDGEALCVRCGASLPRIRIDAQSPAPQSPAPAPAGGDLQFQRGQVVAGRYSVLNLIGRGGMGAIYKVHDNVLGEAVALKTLLPQFVRDKMVVERFFNEAKIARRLAHPNIVRVHDIGNADNSVYISMEYVQGISLRSMLEGLPAGQRIPLQKVLAIIDALCAALEYAHQFTIHRDIKPENVMVTAEGVVKLMDFGISKLMADTRMTAPSVVMGTPFYMSPEQLKNSRDVDARADIYSVGVLLYETLTGNVPTGVPKPASQISSEVPPAMDAIILKCVATDPRERYSNATELRAALRPIIELVRSGGAAALMAQEKETRPRADFPWRKAAGWLLLAGLGAGSVFGLYRLEGHRQSLSAAAIAGAETLEEDAPTVTGGALGWRDFSALIEEVSKVAVVKSGAAPELTQMYQRGAALWQQVQEKGGVATENDQMLARHALQYFVGTLMGTRTSGMVLVPDTRMEVDGKAIILDPFFMDEKETTVEEWRGFCGNSQDGWPACVPTGAAGPEGLPMTGVRFFEAEAFAAAQGKLLPTSEQWSAAAYAAEGSSSLYPWGDEFADAAANTGGYGPAPVGSFDHDRTGLGILDMEGNVAEWTRTPAGPGAKEPGFGVNMVVRGGSFRGPAMLSETGEADFYASLPFLGFRCVVEIPTDPEIIRELLRRSV